MVVAFGVLGASGAWAQAAKQEPAKTAAPAAAAAALPTADELVEKHLAALGGRAVLAKLQSRSATVSISMNIQGNEVAGSGEMYNKAPNKSRNYMRMDLSPFGMGEVVVDTRCDGKTAWSSDTMQGDRDITGDQLQSMLNQHFPTSLLTLKEDGAKFVVIGKEKVGGADAYVDAYVAEYTPKAGPASKQYFDAKTFLPIRTVSKINTPQTGEIEQMVEASDFRDVDGTKVPFVVKIVNPMQVITITMKEVAHNKPIDEALFSKPAK
jgi:outer membrane lipoprotein-sorting protein